MSQITDEVVKHVYNTYGGTRCCIVVFYNVNHDHGWTAKAHPFMQESMPSILRNIANDLEIQQQKRKQVKRLGRGI